MPDPHSHINAGQNGAILGFAMYSISQGPEKALAQFTQVIDALAVFEREDLEPAELIRFQLEMDRMWAQTAKYSMTFPSSPDAQDNLAVGDVGIMTGRLEDPDFLVLCNVRPDLGVVVSGSDGQDSPLLPDAYRRN